MPESALRVNFEFTLFPTTRVPQNVPSLR